VRQGGSSQEQRQHQRKEIHPFEQGTFDFEFQAGAHNPIAGHNHG
jgi:hypothetical protein